MIETRGRIVYKYKGNFAYLISSVFLLWQVLISYYINPRQWC